MGRATVTVVFTDLVGSTGLRARFGEAAITTLLRSYIRQTRGGGPLPRRADDGRAAGPDPDGAGLTLPS
jgi:hypothetical protein